MSARDVDVVFYQELYMLIIAIMTSTELMELMERMLYSHSKIDVLSHYCSGRSSKNIYFSI